MATITVATKRNPGVSVTTGLRGQPMALLSGVKALPLMPLDSAIALRMGVSAPEEKLQTFVDGEYDVVVGDYLTYGGFDYPISHVADWPFRAGDTSLLLIVEDLKRPQ
jgi:hypothetical protein